MSEWQTQAFRAWAGLRSEQRTDQLVSVDTSKSVEVRNLTVAAELEQALSMAYESDRAPVPPTQWAASALTAHFCRGVRAAGGALPLRPDPLVASVADTDTLRIKAPGRRSHGSTLTITVPISAALWAVVHAATRHEMDQGHRKTVGETTTEAIKDFLRAPEGERRGLLEGAEHTPGDTRQQRVTLPRDVLESIETNCPDTHRNVVIIAALLLLAQRFSRPDGQSL